MMRTTWLLFANWKQTSYQRKGKNNEKQQLFNWNTTHNRKDCKITHNRQQTKTLHVNTYEQKQTHKTPNTNNQQLRTHNSTTWEFRLFYKKKNDTNDVAIACKLKIQSAYWHKEQTTNHSFSTETQHKTNIRKYNKQQMTNTYSKCNQRQAKCKTVPQMQTIKHYEQVTVQNENANKTTNILMVRTTWLLLARYKDYHRIDKRKTTTNKRAFNWNATQNRNTTKRKSNNIYTFSKRSTT